MTAKANVTEEEVEEEEEEAEEETLLAHKKKRKRAPSLRKRARPNQQHQPHTKQMESMKTALLAAQYSFQHPWLLLVKNGAFKALRKQQAKGPMARSRSWIQDAQRQCAAVMRFII